MTKPAKAKAANIDKHISVSNCQITNDGKPLLDAVSALAAAAQENAAAIREIARSIGGTEFIGMKITQAPD